jgi:diacylglycerol O-acyltransferase/trehalose O-mycolyltransferase
MPLSRTCGRRSSVIVAAAVLLGLTGLTTASSAGALLSPSTTIPVPPATEPRTQSSVEVVREQRLTERLIELTVFSSVLQRETSLRVLFPSGGRSPVGMPVLWLFHGGDDDYRSWTDKGAAEEITHDLPLVVVMPDSGPGGWYTDWRTRSTSQGLQLWETLHVHELRRFLEQRYRTRSDRAGRAAVGLSMGGYGALHYATRHPDLFGFAATFSGSVDILHPGVSAVADALSTNNGGKPGDIWGNRIAHEARWRANNPVDLAENLRTVETQIRTGNGQPGGPHGGGPDVIEMGVHQSSSNLHRRLDELEIKHVWQDRGPGAHDWPYWQDDLRATLPRIVAAAAEARPAPETVQHVAFEPAYAVWGWDVALHRPVLEVSRLTVDSAGFKLLGTGRGTVRTPGRFRPGTKVTASITDVRAGRASVTLLADADGRVAVPVDLGEPSMRDQYPASSPATAPAFGEVAVELRQSGIALDSTGQTAAPDGEAAQTAVSSHVSAAGERLPATGGSAALAGLALIGAAAAALAKRCGATYDGRTDR